MSDSSVPPSSKSPSSMPVSGTSGRGGVSAASPARIIVNDAPVRQSPSGPRGERGDKEPHRRMEGRVTSYNRETREARIATREGEVVVKSETPIPPDTEVLVELYTRNGAELARIALLKAQAELAGDTAQMAPAPYPPLKPGDTMTALLLPPDDGKAPAPPQTPLQQAALVLEKLGFSDLQQLPQPLPVPNSVVAQLATAGNMLEALQQLPQQQQQDIIQYLSRADVAEVLKEILPQAVARMLPEAQDSEFAELVRGMITAKTAPKEGAPAPPRTGALGSLMPLLETLQNTQGPGGLAPRMPAPSDNSVLSGLLPKNIRQVTIVAVTPPQQEPPPAPPQALQGTVEFISSEGFPAVKAGEEIFILRQQAHIDIGSTVTFEAAAMTARQVMASYQTSAAGFSPLASAAWPALQEVLLTVSSMPAVSTALQNSLPSPSPQLTPTTLFFLSALRLGTVESWLGAPLLQSLRDAGKQGLAERLAGDFGKISAQARETLAGEWRAVSLPMLYNDEISQIQLFIRRHQEDDEENDKPGGYKAPKRFVLNLHLSRMGDMQIDGLLRKRTFDVILRTAEALPQHMRRELTEGFAKGLSQVRLQGEISFQTRAQKWVTIDVPHQGTLA